MLHRVIRLFHYCFSVLKTMFDCCSRSPRVFSKAGEVHGSRLKTTKGETILCFRGIPYAAPPVGDLRFKRSRPSGAWSGILNGRKESKKSLQPNVMFPEKEILSQGGEDCLYLNVYTKTTDESAKQPVVVFLHGGAFVVGACESMLYGPQILLEKDIVMVGVNYRLGILGFLSLDTDDAPGNLGLHDQYLALQWVRDHITEFGGDPDNVTLMGESAGSMSAMLHLVSPLTRGLFHRVIGLSGSPTTPFLHTDRKSKLYGIEVAKKLGCEDTEDLDKVLKYLQKQSFRSILATSTLFTDWDHGHPMPWVPCLDLHSSQPMVPRDFNSAVDSGAAGAVPVIMGCCKDEGLILTAKFFKEPERWSLMSKEWNIWAPLFLFNRERDETTVEDREDVEEIKQFYFGDQDIGLLPPQDEHILKLTDMCSVSWFLNPMDRDSKRIAKNGGKVFTFVLTSPPDFSLFELFRLSLKDIGAMFTCRSLGFNPYNKLYGVCHGDDLCFMFPMGVPGFPKCVRTQQQKQTQQDLIDMVFTFALKGEPMLRAGEVEWTPITEGNHQYLDMGSTLYLTRDEYLDKQYQLWSRIKVRQEERDLGSSLKPFSSFFKKIAVKRL